MDSLATRAPALPIALAAALVLLAGCPARSGSPAVHDPAGHGQLVTTNDGNGADAAGPDAGAPGPDSERSGSADAAPRLPLSGIPCAAQTCMYHAGTGTYHLCLSSGAGTCFHYGRPCAPADGCMYDESSATYRTCAQVSEGRCLTFAAACEPADRCVYSRVDGLHRVCEEQSASGACVRVGDLCEPR